jgi:hypothetical protein
MEPDSPLADGLTDFLLDNRLLSCIRMRKIAGTNVERSVCEDDEDEGGFFVRV